MSVVIDASVALSWCFEDEITPDTDELLDRVREGGGFVPGLWHLEMANGLLQAERRGRLSATDVVAGLDLMAKLPIVADTESAVRTHRQVLGLARAERLTVYDAAYLELALRLGLPLATQDRALRTAARRMGTSVLPL